jgi:DUF1009 family protein
MRALIAGQGALPARVVAAMPVPPLVCAMEGYLPEAVRVDRVFRLETLGSLLRDLAGEGVREVVFAGRIRRPEIDPGLIDAATEPLVPILLEALASGDDAALRAVIGLFETAGMQVLGVNAFCPDLLLPEGIPTERTPDEAQRRDVEKGAAFLTLLSQGDIGQACVVHRGQALALEGVFGTDWMLESLSRRPDAGGGILVKAPKAGQDLRVDMPVIGPQTVELAATARLDGIAIRAGQVLVLERDAVLERCAAAGLFLWSRDP